MPAPVNKKVSPRNQHQPYTRPRRTGVQATQSPCSCKSPRPISAATAATVSAFFSFRGWWEAGKVAGEVRNPRRTLPLAFTLGVLIVTAVYLLVSFAFLSVVPVERIVSNTAFVAQFGEALFGSVGGRVLSACVLLSVLGGLMALTMAAPRGCP